MVSGGSVREPLGGTMKLTALQKGNIFNSINSLHKDSEYVYSDQGLEELCEANEYEFTEEGKVI